MKNLFKLFWLPVILMSMATMYACGGKDDESSDPIKRLEGTWKCTSTASSDGLNYDVLTLQPSKTGSWLFYYKNGSIKQYEIVSWTATTSKLVMDIKVKGTDDNPVTNTKAYEFNGSELIVDSYVYIRQ